MKKAVLFSVICVVLLLGGGCASNSPAKAEPVPQIEENIDPAPPPPAPEPGDITTAPEEPAVVPVTPPPSVPAARAPVTSTSTEVPLPPPSPEPAKMVWINGGTFTMGSPVSESGRLDREGPQHQVTVSGFYMGNYEVTQKEYEEVMGTNPSYFKGPNLPVEQVSWFDAVEYCNRRSRREGLTPAYTIRGRGDNRTVTWNPSAGGYRLPTEAEWEYACRAGTIGPYYTGKSVDSAGWDYDNSEGTTHPAGEKKANPWGLYDMHGNVWEWCGDWYGNYPGSPQTDPEGASPAFYRVNRSGGWKLGAQFARSAYRSLSNPSDRLNDLGFRVVRPAATTGRSL